MPLRRDLCIHLKITSFLNVVPKYDTRTRTFVGRRFRSYILAAVHVCWYVYSIYGVKTSKKKLPVSYWIIFIMMSFFMLTSVVLSILRTCKHTRTWQKLFDLFDSVDEEILKLGGDGMSQCKLINYQIGLVTLASIATATWSFFIWSRKDDLTKFLYFVAYQFESYMVLLTAILVYYFLYAITVRLTNFSDFVEGLGDMRLSPMDVVRKIEALTSLSKKIYDICDLINSLFGYHMFLAYLCLIFNVLLTVDSFLSGESTDGLQGSLFIVFWTIYLMSHGIILVNLSEEVAGAGKRAVIVSGQALEWYSNDSKARRKLAIMCQQVTYRSPTITASGFFKIDYAMLFNFVNMIATYIIVLFQLPK